MILDHMIMLFQPNGNLASNYVRGQLHSVQLERLAG